MKKKIITLLMTATLVLSGVSGMTMSVSAANTKDRDYSFDNRNTTGYTSWLNKDNDSKVYVYPESGPLLNYRVEGRYNSGESDSYSNWVQIPNGVQGSITNYVNEKGKNQARLKVKRTAYAQVWTKGVWSPDSTRNYTVFN